MVDYKLILVPTDLSDSSKVAFPHAGFLARTHGAEILLVHVVVPSPYVPYGFAADESAALQGQINAAAVRRLESLLPEFGEGVAIRSLICNGSAAESLVKVTQDQGVDLIVMATGGESKLERFLLGSVAEKVLRRVACPVVAVPVC